MWKKKCQNEKTIFISTPLRLRFFSVEIHEKKALQLGPRLSPQSLPGCLQNRTSLRVKKRCRNSDGSKRSQKLVYFLYNWKSAHWHPSRTIVRFPRIFKILSVDGLKKSEPDPVPHKREDRVLMSKRSQKWKRTAHMNSERCDRNSLCCASSCFLSSSFFAAFVPFYIRFYCVHIKLASLLTLAEEKGSERTRKGKISVKSELTRHSGDREVLASSFSRLLRGSWKKAQFCFFGKKIESIKRLGQGLRWTLESRRVNPGQNNCTNVNFRDLCLSLVVKSRKQARKASECGTLKIHSSKSFNLINEM